MIKAYINFQHKFQMDSLKKQSDDQLSKIFTVDDIPTIDVGLDRKTLRSKLETINSILRHGESHLKSECVGRIDVSLFMYINNPKQAMIYEKAVIKTKVLDTMLYLMKYEDYNELIFKNDDTRQLNAEMARCMCSLSNFFAALCEVIVKAGGISYFTDICRFKPFLDNLENEFKAKNIG
ncbi:unnamed protein product [Mytilus edulis]|uniref:Uncharacterized protein n=1 Tax=Mytilus edulis TaxID=6550 RepID=A0A8S3RR71_MYTED|nr:unnamed protein product [Mytilus edulis]